MDIKAIEKYKKENPLMVLKIVIKVLLIFPFFVVLIFCACIAAVVDIIIIKAFENIQKFFKRDIEKFSGNNTGDESAVS